MSDFIEIEIERNLKETVKINFPFYVNYDDYYLKINKDCLVKITCYGETKLRIVKDEHYVRANLLEYYVEFSYRQAEAKDKFEEEFDKIAMLALFT